MKKETQARYDSWTERATEKDILNELDVMDELSIEESFYQDLKFGTGGLRGIIGAGTNRMNVYTVGRASQGVAEYILEHYEKEKRSVAVAYDTRRKSRLFAEKAADVFAANGIKVWMFDEPMPTPVLSFAVRRLECAVGVVITASHNPAVYNGYKVYGKDGCQITNAVADLIYENIQKTDYFSDVKQTDGRCDRIQSIDEAVVEDFTTQAVKAASVAPHDELAEISIVYTPLNGTGRKPVLEALYKAGFKNVVIVKEQEEPDGNFPTCPKPNPEEAAAMQLGLEYCKRYAADVLIATDPDCDRVAIALRENEGSYRLMNTNEVGVLLLDFICQNCDAKDKVLLKTIVTTDMAELLAKHYEVAVVNTLTGFKYIGEQIGELEKQGELKRFLFAFEESCGYLSGTYVRDKDGVNASILIVNMVAYYKKQGKTPQQRLGELYQQFGFCLNEQKSLEYTGKEGVEKISLIMRNIRAWETDKIGGWKIITRKDYQKGIDGLPVSNVIKYYFEGGSTLTIRPSGTEPKLKLYFSIIEKDEKEARFRLRKVEQSIKERMDEGKQR